MLVKAVVEPKAETPPVTLQDAKRMYFKERIEGEKGRNKRDQLERVCRRVEGALGPLGKLPLVDLKREHVRRLRDFLLKETKSDGTLWRLGLCSGRRTCWWPWSISPSWSSISKAER